MPRPFEPLFLNPDILTVLGNFWPRGFDFSRYPMTRRLVRTDADTQLLVQTQTPAGEPIGEVVLLHGLEGGGDAGYIVSMAWRALQAGFIAHRFHMRTCGGTEALCKTLYHAGLTQDLHEFLRQLRAEGRDLPVFPIGFSLGGNVALKLAGELGQTELIQGVCALSTPIDLAACAARIGEARNRIYERRFLKRMRARLMATGRYQRHEVESARSVYAIDDAITAPSFGFRGADHYYETQSAARFLDRIRVPALLIQAKDDPYIPFRTYDHPAFRANPCLKLIAVEHGGHLGFLAKRPPRFWADEVTIGFIRAIANGEAPPMQLDGVRGFGD